MSSNIKYEPLSPIYQSTKSDEEIALEDFSAAPVATQDECCAKDNNVKACKKRSIGERLCRCLAVTVMLGAMLWMITGVAFATYLGAKAHRCLHPRHQHVQEFTWSPSSLSNLELGLVAGSVFIRSCPMATNVSLTVRSFAASPALLGNMLLDVTDIANGKRLVLSAPSFDWAHCQRASYELIVPEGAKLDVKAQGIIAHMDVRATNDALRHVVLSATAAHVDVRNSDVAGTLRVDSEIAVVKVRELKAAGVVSDVRVGYVELRGVDAKGAAVSSTLRIGRSVIAHVDADSVTHASELAHVSAYGLDASSVALRVDSGSLSLMAQPSYGGSFAAHSPYGFLEMRHGDQVSTLVKTKDTPAAIEGHVDAPNRITGHVDKPRTVSLEATYGSVDLFLPNPLTQWEQNHRAH